MQQLLLSTHAQTLEETRWYPKIHSINLLCVSWINISTFPTNVHFDTRTNINLSNLTFNLTICFCIINILCENMETNSNRTVNNGESSILILSRSKIKSRWSLHHWFEWLLYNLILCDVEISLFNEFRSQITCIFEECSKPILVRDIFLFLWSHLKTLSTNIRQVV